jgi:murein DD-endopeptidase MepM/ murein hydrolase activator NlpD
MAQGLRGGIDGLFDQKPAKRRRPSFLPIAGGPYGRDQKGGAGFWGFFRRNALAVRAAGLLCLALLFGGVCFLVYSAVTAPELPPGNLVSTLQDMAEYYADPENSRNFPAVVLPPDDSQWASLTIFEEMETGAGSAEPDRSEDIEYRVRPGETLSEIARAYGVSYNLLAYYNDITNANRIRMGTVIRIPSLENAGAAERQMALQPRRSSPAARVITKSVKIDYESRPREAGPGLAVQFSILEPSPETFHAFEWEFGDGKRGFRSNPSYEYTLPKTYVARLTARDAGGAIYKSNPLYIDIPHPSSVAEYNTTRFVTLSAPDEHFVVNGNITGVARYASVEAAPLDLSESDQFLTKVRFTKPGFYGITANEGGIEQYYSVFVSPLPSMHADIAQENYNWYRTQFNTGTTSNCGPASVSMAIGWSLGKYFPVSSVRQAVGWQGDGGTSFEELRRVLQAQGIASSIEPLRSVQNVKDVIDSGAIAIVLFRTDGVRSTRDDPASNLFGKYYNDSVGHYSVIKGYSLNGEYFVIHDPIPSDWGANSFRYGDEVSMIGRNRYYSSAEFLRSLRRADMIVVSRPED